MALIPRNVTLLASQPGPVQLVDVQGFDGSPVTLVPNVAIDLLTIAADEDLAKSRHLANLQADGLITVNSTFDTANTQATAVSAISGAILDDGTIPMAAALAMGTNKITGLAAGTATGDAARFDEVDLKALKDSTTAAATSTQVATADSAAMAALTSSQEATADGSDAATTQTLANALKASYNQAQVDIADVKAKYDAAVTLINEIKADYNVAQAEIVEMRGIIDNMNA